MSTNAPTLDDHIGSRHALTSLRGALDRIGGASPVLLLRNRQTQPSPRSSFLASPKSFPLFSLNSPAPRPHTAVPSSNDMLTLKENNRRPSTAVQDPGVGESISEEDLEPSHQLQNQTKSASPTFSERSYQHDDEEIVAAATPEPVFSPSRFGSLTSQDKPFPLPPPLSARRPGTARPAIPASPRTARSVTSMGHHRPSTSNQQIYLPRQSSQDIGESGADLPLALTEYLDNLGRHPVLTPAPASTPTPRKASARHSVTSPASPRPNTTTPNPTSAKGTFQSQARAAASVRKKAHSSALAAANTESSSSAEADALLLLLDTERQEERAARRAAAPSSMQALDRLFDTPELQRRMTIAANVPAIHEARADALVPALSVLERAWPHSDSTLHQTPRHVAATAPTSHISADRHHVIRPSTAAASYNSPEAHSIVSPRPMTSLARPTTSLALNLTSLQRSTEAASTPQPLVSSRGASALQSPHSGRPQSTHRQSRPGGDAASFGLSRAQFAAEMQRILPQLPAREVDVLYDRVDANSVNCLTWDDYVTYLVREVSLQWDNSKLHYCLCEPDESTVSLVASATAVDRILIAPPASWKPPSAGALARAAMRATHAALAATESGAPSSPSSPVSVSNSTEIQYGTYILSMHDHSIAVLDAQRMKVICRLPPHVQPFGMSTVTESESAVSSVDDVRLFNVAGTPMPAITFHSVKTVVETQPEQTETKTHQRQRGPSAKMIAAINAAASGPPPHLSNKKTAAVSQNNKSDKLIPHTTIAYNARNRNIMVAYMDRSIAVYSPAYSTNGIHYVHSAGWFVPDAPPSCMAVANVDLPPYQPDAHPLLNTHSYRPAVRISAGKTSAGKYWHAEPPTLVGVPVSVAAASLVSTSLQSAIQQLKQDQASQQAVAVNNTAHKQTIEMETLSFSQRDLLLVGDTRGQTSIYDILTQRCLARKAMHNEQSVRKILWGGSLGLLSAGMDGKVVIADIEKLTYRALSGHTRGIHTLVNAPMHRLLVTAGFDHKILLFDPFISHNIGALPRIDTPVVDVMVNEMHNQIICVTQDKSIRIFDIRRPSQCMQVLTDPTKQQPEDQLTASAFDPFGQRLVTAGNHLTAWPVVVPDDDEYRKHSSSDVDWHLSAKDFELNFADLFTQTSNIETFVQKKEKEDAEILKQELERKEKEKKEKLLLQRASSVVKPAEPSSVTIYESFVVKTDASTDSTSQSASRDDSYLSEHESKRKLYDSSRQSLFDSAIPECAPPQTLKALNSVRLPTPIVGVCFSQLFNQLIVVFVDHRVQVFDLFSGASVREFNLSLSVAASSATRGDSELTSMCLDAQGKRLVVATHHGLIAVFNFQAGQMLHSYNHKGSVSALLFLDRTQTPLMAVGWSAALVRYPDPRDARIVSVQQRQQAHKAEITSVVAQSTSATAAASTLAVPLLMFSASIDGELVAWQTDNLQRVRSVHIPARRVQKSVAVAPSLVNIGEELTRPSTPMSASSSSSSPTVKMFNTAAPTPRLTPAVSVRASSPALSQPDSVFEINEQLVSFRVSAKDLISPTAVSAAAAAATTSNTPRGSRIMELGKIGFGGASSAQSKHTQYVPPALSVPHSLLVAGIESARSTAPSPASQLGTEIDPPVFEPLAPVLESPKSILKQSSLLTVAQTVQSVEVSQSHDDVDDTVVRCASVTQLALIERPPGFVSVNLPVLPATSTLSSLLLFVACDDGCMLIYDGRSLQLLHSMVNEFAESILCLKLNSVGTRLFMTDFTEARLYDIADLSRERCDRLFCLARFRPFAPTISITSAAYCPVANTFALSSDSGAVVLYDEQGEYLATCSTPTPWPHVLTSLQQKDNGGEDDTESFFMTSVTAKPAATSNSLDMDALLAAVPPPSQFGMSGRHYHDVYPSSKPRERVNETGIDVIHAAYLEVNEKRVAIERYDRDIARDRQKKLKLGARLDARTTEFDASLAPSPVLTSTPHMLSDLSRHAAFASNASLYKSGRSLVNKRVALSGNEVYLNAQPRPPMIGKQGSTHQASRRGTLMQPSPPPQPARSPPSQAISILTSMNTSPIGESRSPMSGGSDLDDQ